MKRFNQYQRIFFGGIHLLILIILICRPTAQHAQDSLWEHELDIADSLFATRDYAKTDLFLDSLAASAQDNGLIDIESRAIYYKAKVKHNTYHHKDAIKLYQLFRKCRTQANLQYDTFVYHRNIAVCYAAISKPNIAINHFDTAYLYLDKSNNLESGDYFGGLAYFFGSNDQDSLALELTKNALNHFRKEDVSTTIMWYVYDLAFYAEELGKYQESIRYLDTVLQMAEQEKDTMVIWMGLACKGINEIKLERYENGINYMEQAAELEGIFDQKLCCANDVFIALGYAKLGQTDKISVHLDKAFAQLPDVVDRNDRSDVYRTLSEVYIIVGDDRKALEYYRKYQLLDDTIANKSYLNQVAIQEVKLEQHKLLNQIRDSQKIQQTQQIKYSKTKKMLLIALLGFIIFLGLYLWNLRKLRSYKYDYQLWKLAFEASSETTTSENPHQQEAQWLQMAKQQVVNNLNNEAFKVADLAKLLSITQRELNTRLNANLKMTANKFIRTIRIENAKELLLKSSKTVAEISYEVGFTDSAYFSRVFKSATGVAPKNWSASQS